MQQHHFVNVEYVHEPIISKMYFISDCRYRVWVLILTYLAYMSYHMSRKPISVVKAVLNQNCSTLEPPPGVFVNSTNRNTWCDWAPFGMEINIGLFCFELIL
jgi:multisubunit Na+/H+ antiporter MnhE subunit